MYDSNWSSGLEVLRLAYDAILSGECEAAIVGASNLCYYRSFHQNLIDMRVISPDGSTRAFDENGKYLTLYFYELLKTI